MFDLGRSRFAESRVPDTLNVVVDREREAGRGPTPATSLIMPAVGLAAVIVEAEGKTRRASLSGLPDGAGAADPTDIDPASCAATGLGRVGFNRGSAKLIATTAIASEAMVTAAVRRAARRATSAPT
jgi:hypothetical protein